MLGDTCTELGVRSPTALTSRLSCAVRTPKADIPRAPFAGRDHGRIVGTELAGTAADVAVSGRAGLASLQRATLLGNAVTELRSRRPSALARRLGLTGAAPITGIPRTPLTGRDGFRTVCAELGGAAAHEATREPAWAVRARSPLLRRSGGRIAGLLERAARDPEDHRGNENANGGVHLNDPLVQKGSLSGRSESRAIVILSAGRDARARRRSCARGGQCGPSRARLTVNR